MSDAETRDGSPRSPLNRLEQQLKQKKEEAAEQKRQSDEWQQRAMQNLQKARQDVNSVIAPTLVAAQKRLAAMGLKALTEHDTRAIDPYATIRWGENVQTPKGIKPRHTFLIIAVNRGESFKAITAIFGRPLAEVTVPSPIDPAWIEEELTSAIEATLQG